MVKSHVHAQQGTFSTVSQSSATTSTESANHAHSFAINIAFQDGPSNLGHGEGAYLDSGIATAGGWVNVQGTSDLNYTIPVAAMPYGATTRMLSIGGNTGLDSTDHTHQFEHTHSTTISGNTSSNNVNNNENRPENFTVKIWKRTA